MALIFGRPSGQQPMPGMSDITYFSRPRSSKNLASSSSNGAAAPLGFGFGGAAAPLELWPGAAAPLVASWAAAIAARSFS